MHLKLMTMATVFMIGTQVSFAKESRKDQCTKDAKDKSFCENLEAKLVALENQVRVQRKDKAWKIICPARRAKRCAPELDIDLDGKIDTVVLLENKKKRAIGIVSPGKDIVFLEKTSDIDFPFSQDKADYNLQNLEDWLITKVDSPFLSEHREFCDMKPGSEVLDLGISGSHFALTVKGNRFCIIGIGD